MLARLRVESGSYYSAINHRLKYRGFAKSFGLEVSQAGGRWWPPSDAACNRSSKCLQRKAERNEMRERKKISRTNFLRFFIRSNLLVYRLIGKRDNDTLLFSFSSITNFQPLVSSRKVRRGSKADRIESFLITETHERALLPSIILVFEWFYWLVDSDVPCKRRDFLNRSSTLISVGEIVFRACTSFLSSSPLNCVWKSFRCVTLARGREKLTGTNADGRSSVDSLLMYVMKKNGVVINVRFL